MFSKNCSVSIIGSSFMALSWITPVSADTFKPMKFLQDASVVTALATAVSQLSACEEDLRFSEKRKKEEGGDGDIITVTVVCRKFPDDNGKLVKSIVRVELELNKDGSVGSPLSFSYD